MVALATVCIGIRIFADTQSYLLACFVDRVADFSEFTVLKFGLVLCACMSLQWLVG
jgi:hypothetical protein